jgi:hypothetical protein
MMSDADTRRNAAMSNLHTPQELLNALKAAVKQPTPGELRDQSVSFIMGSVGSDSGITRADVESALSMQTGG